MRCLTVFALFMWLLVVSRSSNYWLGMSPPITLLALVDVKVCLGKPSCVTRWVPRGSRGLILGSTGRGRPLLYPAIVFPTLNRLGHETLHHHIHKRRQIFLGHLLVAHGLLLYRPTSSHPLSR